jgi:ribosomal protein S1
MIEKITYGDPNLAHVFERDKKGFNNNIKTRKGEVVYSNEDYAAEFYAELCGMTYYPNIPSDGDIVKGKFVSNTSDELLFDIGSKDWLRIEATRKEIDLISGKNVGDEFDILVLEVSDKPYLIKGSIAALNEAVAHQDMKDLNSNDSVEVYVGELTPAGYSCEINHNGVKLSAFMPNTLAGVNKLYDPSEIVGKTFEVAIESFSSEKGTYIVSRRKYLKTLIPKEIKKLEMDKVYTGHVTGTTPFGIFIEFNECLTGMIHKSNINPEFSDRINEITPGTEIDFYIKEVIKGSKIILTQIIKETLWDELKPFQKIDGTVKGIKPFGVLVELDSETIGLIHQSEVDKVKNRNFKIGDNVTVKVISVDKMNRKIFLTI